jgi:hypothetical protein
MIDVEALAREAGGTFELIDAEAHSKAGWMLDDKALGRLVAAALEEAARVAESIHAETVPDGYSSPSWEQPYSEGAKACAAAVRALKPS